MNSIRIPATIEITRWLDRIDSFIASNTWESVCGFTQSNKISESFTASLMLSVVRTFHSHARVCSFSGLTSHAIIFLAGVSFALMIPFINADPMLPAPRIAIGRSIWWCSPCSCAISFPFICIACSPLLCVLRFVLFYLFAETPQVFQFIDAVQQTKF